MILVLLSNLGFVFAIFFEIWKKYLFNYFFATFLILHATELLKYIIFAKYSI